MEISRSKENNDPMDDKYMSLITDYMEGTFEGSRKAEFEQYVSDGHIDLKEIEELMLFENKVSESSDPVPSEKLTDNFYQMLAEEKAKKEGSLINQVKVFVDSLFSSSQGKWAFAAGVLIIGLVLGRGFSGVSYEKQMDQLASQMADMQEMMAISMLEESSVSKRLQGVQMSSELVTTNEEIANALLITLNNDESSNVRLAALNMLAEFSDDENIREGLINSIQNQSSPIVLLAMAELMVELQEKKALEEFEGVIDSDRAPEDLKSTLRENMNKIM